MTEYRAVKHIIQSKPTLEGAGVHLHRVFGFGRENLYDPFLLLDDFRGEKPDDFIAGFPFHPHRGIETITYLIEGSVEHQDSLGNKGVIGPGDVQWMTAGSGIVHQEMPQGNKVGRMGGFQLWANLPAAQKMMDPRYRDVLDIQIPDITTANGTRIRIICGEAEGVRGPVEDIVIEPQYLDISIPAGAAYSHPTPLGHTVFAYIIAGEAFFDEGKSARAENRQLVLFEDGEKIVVTAAAAGVRFLLISGKPLREPVAWYGPIVMNTREELEIAFDEYRKGTFIKKSGTR